MVCSIRTECNVRINPSFSTRVVGPETKHLAVAPVALDATHTATSIFNLHVVHVHAVRVYYKVILPHRQALVNSSMMQGGRWTYILTLVCSLSIMYTFVSCLRHFKHTNQPLLYFFFTHLFVSTWLRMTKHKELGQEESGIWGCYI